MPLCAVCSAKEAPYKCPRCGMAYCGTTCYRSHGTECTELFYKEHVQAHLAVAGQKPGDDGKALAPSWIRLGQVDFAQEGLEVEDEVDGLDLDVLCRKLQKILGTEEIIDEKTIANLTTEQLEEALDQDAKKAFWKMLRKGELNEQIGLRPFKPWWLEPPAVYREKRHHAFKAPLVESLDEIPMSHKEYESPMVWFGPGCFRERRLLQTDLQSATLDSIRAPKSIPDTIILHICSALLAYIYTQFEFGGRWIDPSDSSVEQVAMSQVVRHCAVFQSDLDFRPESIDEVLADFEIRLPKNHSIRQERVSSSAEMFNIRETLSPVENRSRFNLHMLQIFLQEEPRLMALDALLDMYFLFKRAKKGRSVARVVHKLWFFAVWLNTYDILKFSSVVQKFLATPSVGVLAQTRD